MYLSNCIECVNCPNQVELAVVLNFKMAEGGYIGTGPFFFNSKDLWFEEWLEILEAWFIVNEITDNENKRAALITKIGIQNPVKNFISQRCHGEIR